LKTVLTRSGDGLVAPASGPGEDSPVTPGQSGNAVLTEMHRLAQAANNTYVYGATGPNGYDCSGLVWRALKNIGIYTGSRFTTSTFPLAARSFAKSVDSPEVGDIVLWSFKHMGVVSGKDKFYSARNRKYGIGESSISGWSSTGTPRYYRISYSLVPPQGEYGTGAGVLK